MGDLATQCAEKKADWTERQKMRAEEISAVSEAIKVLNDDDASGDIHQSNGQLAHDRHVFSTLANSIHL